MQFVFVHGVATRSTDDYKREVLRRDDLFKRVAFSGLKPNAVPEIENPCWGDLVADPAWGGASLPDPKAIAPKDGVETFSLGAALGFAPPAASSSTTLARLAKVNLEAAVDVLLASVVDGADARDSLSAEEFALFEAAAAYLSTTPDTSWINDRMDDGAFAFELKSRILKTRSFSLGGALQAAVDKIADRARNIAASALTSGFRDDVNPLVAKFLGDVFVYLKEGEDRDKIRALLAQSLMRAREKRKSPDEPIVVMGHSMGGVILVDMLSDANVSGLDGFKADLLITVGSQPGFFEEYKLFKASDPKIRKKKGASNTAVDASSLAKPPRLAVKWWNVFDPVDVLAFRCEGIFAGVDDFKFSSVAGLLDSHTAYFKRPTFHQRLRERLNQDGLLR